MQFRQLGRHGLRVSELSLGSWILADDLARSDESAGVIRRAYDMGITSFDTADAYADGRAEIILGRALGVYPRDSYVLATKVYWPTGSGPNDRGLSRKHILRAIDGSLRRLNTDYVDIYYCHWYDSTVPVDETLRALEDVLRQGKALYIGVSNWTATQMQAGQDVIDKYLLNPIAVNQPSYNMLDRYIELETLPYCEAHGIGLVVYSPLAQGMLTGKYRRDTPLPPNSRAAADPSRGAVNLTHYLHPECFRVVEELRPIAAGMGISLAKLALAWALRQPQVSSVLIGASRPEQLDENIAASGIRLPDDVIRKIDAILASMRYTVKHNVVKG